MVKISVAFPLLCVLLLPAPSPVYGQSITRPGAGVGISAALGEGREMWDTGFVFYGEFHRQVRDALFLGGRAAYSRWNANEDQLVEMYSASLGQNLDVSGRTGILELSPAVRFHPPLFNERPVFLQFGAGYYLVEQLTEASTSFRGNLATVSMDQSDNWFGIHFAAGVLIGRAGGIRFSVQPVYNIIYTEQESIKYGTVNLGLVFGY